MTRSYLIALVIVSLLAAVAIYLWNLTMTQYANSHAWFILAWYVCFTAALHFWLTRGSDPKSFVMKFMGVTGIKLMLNLIIILIYGLNNKPMAVTFAIFFLFIYFVFTIFEVSQLNKAFKPKKEN